MYEAVNRKCRPKNTFNTMVQLSTPVTNLPILVTDTGKKVKKND